MYQEFFEFLARPFELTPDPEFLYLSPDLKEVLATLEYGIIQRRGFILLVGKPGTGKTTLLNSLMDKAKRNANFAYLFNPALDFDDLLHTLMVKLGIATVDEELSKTKALHRLNTFVMEEFEKGKNTVIIVDEAQYLDARTLEGLRLLSNLETRTDKLIQIIISGQPELVTTLAQRKLVQLAQRIGLRCQTKPLGEKETHEYIEHRLKIAGYKGPQLFANKATKMIWAYSEGIPRTINIICDNALLTGYSKDAKRIEASIVQEIIKDLNNVRLNDLEPQKEQIRGPVEGKHQKPSERTGGIHDHPTTFSTAEKDLGGGGKERRSSLAWTAAIAAIAIIINVVIFYGLTGNLEDFQNELSLNLESLKEKIEYQSVRKNAQSDEAPKDMLQRLDTNDKNKPDSTEKTSVAKSMVQPVLDAPQSERRVDGVKTGNKGSVVVQKGETLEEIAIRVYRKKDLKTLNAIIKTNPEIKNPNLIYENQIIRLPSKADQDQLGCRGRNGKLRFVDPRLIAGSDQAKNR